MEANYAGTSFLTPDKIGKLQFASKIVNFVADRNQPKALATVGYDDEGVSSQRWHLIKNGLFVDWQTTRDLAAMTGQKKSYGCNHSDSWGAFRSRVCRTSRRARTDNKSLDDLIAGVEKGILIYGDGSATRSISSATTSSLAAGVWGDQERQARRDAARRRISIPTTDFWNSLDGLGGQQPMSSAAASTTAKANPDSRML